jgi:ferredoxin
VLVFLGFAAYLPTTKHIHLVFAWPNTWLFRRLRYGLPPPIDFEKTEKFGIDRVQELPWKSLLDSYACTECGRCNAVCPAHVTAKPLKPMKVLYDVKVNLRDRNGDDILGFRDARGRPLPGKADEEAALEPKTPLVSKLEIDRQKPGVLRFDGAYLPVVGQVHRDEIWACTTRRASRLAGADDRAGELTGCGRVVMMEGTSRRRRRTPSRGSRPRAIPGGSARTAAWSGPRVSTSR